MKKAVVAMLALVMSSCQSSGDKKTELKTEKDKVSYAIGLNIGMTMTHDSLEVDYAALFQGIRDAALDTSKRLMNMEEMKKTMIAWQQGMQIKQMERHRAAGDKNREEGERFLAENRKEQGVVTLPSGLQYKVLVDGKGPSPKANQIVVTNYAGTLINGQEFDSSIRRGQPMEIKVSEVIAGWSEALQLMKVGSKWRLFVPSNLAYGDQGMGETIPPGSALIFELELLGIK